MRLDVVRFGVLRRRFDGSALSSRAVRRASFVVSLSRLGFAFQFFVQRLFFVASCPPVADAGRPMPASSVSACKLARASPRPSRRRRSISSVSGSLALLALLHQLEVVQVRADDVDLLVQHRQQLLAALDVLAELQELAGDAASW